MLLCSPCSRLPHSQVLLPVPSSLTRIPASLQSDTFMNQHETCSSYSSKKRCRAQKCLLQPLSLRAESLLLVLIYAYRIYLGNGYVFLCPDSAVKCKGTIINTTFFLLRVIYCFLLVGSLFLGHHHFAYRCSKNRTQCGFARTVFCGL